MMMENNSSANAEGVLDHIGGLVSELANGEENATVATPPEEELIPVENLPSSVEAEVNQLRFASAEWLPIAKNTPVTLVGAGGIGSWAAIFLSRIGAMLSVYDFDRFESLNLAGQFVNLSSLGRPKVSAISNLCREFGGVEPNAFNNRFTSASLGERVVITGLDTMEARRDVFNTWKRSLDLAPEDQKIKFLLIDGRLAADSYQLYVICGNDSAAIEKYQSTALFSDGEADDTVCSFKQTSHLAAILAGKMVAAFTNHCVYKEGMFVWTVPFLEEFEAPLFCTITTRV